MTHMSDQELSPRRRRGLDAMAEAYGFEFADGPGDYFAHTADHLFGEVWTREGLTHRDRRLLLLGALTAQGNVDVAEIQLAAALGNDELSPEELEEAALFLCYYTGWPNGTKLQTAVGSAIRDHRRSDR